MGGDPTEGEPVPTRGTAGVRGGRRGRCGGSILCHCSYSRAGGGCDGGGVGFHGGFPIIIARVLSCVLLLSAVRIAVFCLSLVCFLSALIGEMEGKECEREEN